MDPFQRLKNSVFFQRIRKTLAVFYFGLLKTVTVKKCIAAS